jgi:hypothetical protein
MIGGVFRDFVRGTESPDIAENLHEYLLRQIFRQLFITGYVHGQAVHLLFKTVIHDVKRLAIAILASPNKPLVQVIRRNLLKSDHYHLFRHGLYPISSMKFAARQVTGLFRPPALSLPFNIIPAL